MRALVVSHSQVKETRNMVSHMDSFSTPFFIPFINDLNKNVEFSIVHHFADYTNMFLVEKSLYTNNANI